MTTAAPPSPPPSRAFAQVARGLRFADLPAAVRERARLHLLDALGVGFAAHAYPFAGRALAGVKAIGAAGDCTVLGRAEGFEVRDAALLNGVLIHGLDFDDTHLASIVHPTATSLPVAMALADQLGAGGADLLAAYVAGAEVAIRIGAAVNGGFHHVGYHATGLLAHFGSAVAAGRLLGLGEDELVAAQGIVGSTASGVQVFLEEGAWTKRFHPGWAAVAGLTAARLASQGFVGPSRPLEGKFGFFETHLQGEAGRLDMAALTDRLGETWRFGETALKPYPVCHFIHGCADAAIELHREIAADEIASVRAFLPQPTLHIVAEPAAAKEKAGNEYEGKFSAQFVVATCLLKGRIGLPELQPDAFVDPQVMGLAARVTCEADPASRFPAYFSGGVEVTLRDGRLLKRHVPVNSGAGERALTPDEVVAKFTAHAAMTASASQAERVCEVVLDLENRPARELMAALRGA